jgi:DNA-binding MarR family transcriptional regulator
MMSSEEGAKRLTELVPHIMGAFHDLGRQHPEEGQLTMRQYQALIIVGGCKELTLTQFCEKLALAPSTGTELANRMIAMEYFSKSTDPIDRRQATLSITAKGRAMLEQRRKALHEMFARFLVSFSDQDRIDFVMAFQKIFELFTKAARIKAEEAAADKAA